MLYFSRPIGGGAAGPSLHPTFGLKLAQVRLMPSSGDPQATNEPMQHHELVNWQLGGHSGLHLSDMRVQFGRRLTWDVSRGSFGRPSQPGIAIGPTALRASLAGIASRPQQAQGTRVAESDRMERMEATLGAARTSREGNSGRPAEHNMAALTMAALGPAQSIFLPHRAVPHPHEMPRNNWLQR
jgi:hypothetical protein